MALINNLKEQYAEFLKRLKTLTATYEIVKTTDPKDLIKKFFNTEDKLFVGIEMII
jgi:glutaredoxin-related protein